MKIILTKGLPASGKTTWAKEYQKENPNTVLVNKDELRAMLHGGVHSKGRENFVLMMRDYVIITAVLEGHDVIVHDTNFNPIHEKKIRSLFDGMLPNKKIEFETKDFSDVPLDECILRDSKRSNSVGSKVIKSMWKQYLKPAPVVYERVEGLPEAIICDLDGTLALFGDANPYERDFLKDEVNYPVFTVLRRMSGFSGVELFTPPRIILVSGRDGQHRKQTEKWLDEIDVNYDELFMREPTDKRKDSIVKHEIFLDKIKDKYNVLFVLDDRNQVVEMWRSLGLTVFQVAEGDF